MGDPTLDDGALARLERIGGNDFVAEMIELFLEHAPRRLSEAREAYEGGDLPTLHRAVHSLKATAANVGAYNLRETAAAAEDRANEHDMDAIPPLLDDLDRDYAAVQDALAAERERRQGHEDEHRSQP